MSAVIFFKQKPAPAVPAAAAPPAKVDGPEREDAVVSKRKKTDSDGTLRRKRQTAEDNRLL
jgi:hypothetical protein